MHFGANTLGGYVMQGRKPFREEWKIFSRNNLDSREWLVQKISNNEMYIVHKHTGEEKVIPV